MNTLKRKTATFLLLGMAMLPGGYAKDIKAMDADYNMVTINAEYKSQEDYNGILNFEISGLSALALEKAEEIKDISFEACISEYFEVSKENLGEDIIVEDTSDFLNEIIKKNLLGQMSEDIISIDIPLKFKEEYLDNKELTEFKVLNSDYFLVEEEKTSGAILKYTDESGTYIFMDVDSPVMTASVSEEVIEEVIEEAPEEKSEEISEPQPEEIPEEIPEESLDVQPEEIPETFPEEIPEITPDTDSEDISQEVSEEADMDFEMSIKSDTDKLKAGTTVVYEVTVRNTGNVVLDEVELKSIFSCPKITYFWNENENHQVKGNILKAMGIKPGEEKTYYLSANLLEEQSGTLKNIVTVTGRNTEHDQEKKKEISLNSEVEELKADFQVIKTADRKEAFPGDTVYYQICIQNTGERTLHSVITTEGFVNANVKAQFVPKEGVILNNGRTKALIGEILPGKSITLSAFVVIPNDLENTELLNRVTVTSKETGDKIQEAESGIQIQKLPEQEGGFWGDSGTDSSILTDSPKTGDETRICLMLLLLLCSALSATGVFWNLKGKRNIENDHEV